MEKFLRLPLWQRFVVMGVIMLLVGGVYYMLVISDAMDRISSEEGKTRRIQAEYNSLADYKDKDKRDKLLKDFEDEEKKIEENKKMLPSEEEIPSFIMSIKADADLAGLEILKFQTKDSELEDYYKRIPIEMTVRGNFHSLVKFYKTLAAPKKRIVNITEMDVAKLKMNLGELKKELGQSAIETSEEQMKEAKAQKDKTQTPQEARLRNIRDWQEANKMSLFKAKFVANTFSYTGEPLPEADKAKRLKNRIKRSGRR
jgi:type IV pilus assembly protein PilO